jgi:hypothetical protein
MSDETVTSFREGHAACPFVAFEDDRDHRADHPDYRHRCFAAADAAGEPRALPHQERFCLSAAFAQCPIFLDWARQEAAGVVDRAAAAAAAADEAAAASARVATGAPAFLAGRGRTTPAEATPAGTHSSDPGSGLWGFEGAPKRTIASATAPVRTTPSAPVVAMAARREPTRPAWENPPRMDNFPRLRAREDRSNNQPLALAAMGVVVLLVALIAYGVFGGGGTGAGPGSSPSPKTSNVAVASGASGDILATPTAEEATPTAVPTLRHYIVGHAKWEATLTSIAAHFGVSLALVEQANPLGTVWKGSKSYDVVYPGMTILIPWPEWTPSPPPPTPSPTPKVTPTPKATPTPFASV